MTPADPYATPLSGPSSIAPDSLPALGELVKGWEKLRLLYNAILLLPGIGLLSVFVSRGEMTIPVAVVSGLFGGLSANAAFFAGPVAELYLRVIFFRGAPQPWLRKCLFAGGLLLSFAAMGLFLIGTLMTDPLPLPPQ